MFTNEPLTSFSNAANRNAFQNALHELNTLIQSKSLKAAPIIGGRERTGGETFIRHDPSDSSIVISETNFASLADAQDALREARAGSPAWEHTPAEIRADCLKRAAKEIRERKFYYSALLVREAGKTWSEADADTAEAIDFCEFYAEEMLRLAPPYKTQEVAGEDNVTVYQPRGVAVVIPPWNFPFAIALGMTAAALVVGNTAILKPSEQTSFIGAEIVRLFHRAGVPTSALHFVPGWGEKVGRELVQSPLTDAILFTGSRPVGLEIISAAAKVHPGQRSIKRVVAELGGKNALIVDETADLDDALSATIASAFGFAGQKCSALSRLIVVGEIYEPFLARVIEATKDLKVGKASDPATNVSPVIDEESRRRIEMTVVDAAKTETLAYRGTVSLQGNFVAPAIFRDVTTTSSLWREEIFGPVIAAVNVKTFEDALTLANDSDYALTGGVFSRTPSHLEKARTHFKVGNLYLNKKITGAFVGRHPFGGFKMSGIGSKAGGRDYLIQLMEPRLISENTTRKQTLK